MRGMWMEIELTSDMIQDLHKLYANKIIGLLAKKRKSINVKAELKTYEDKFSVLSKEMQRLKIKGKTWYKRKQ